VSPSLTLLLSLSLSQSAHAAPPVAVDPARYPRQATVDPLACGACPLPARAGQGVLRIPVPLDLRSPADPADASDLALLDAQGQPLAVAVARGLGEAETVPLFARATEDRDTWIIDDPDRPLDGLDLDLWGSEWAVTAAVDRWTGSAWTPVAGPRLLWAAGGASDRRLALPRGTDGRLRLRLLRHFAPRFSSPDLSGVLWTAPHVDPVELSLPISQAALQENGWTRYTVALPRPLPVQAVRLEVSDPVFERQVDVELSGQTDPWYQPSGDSTIRRVLLGGATLDQVTVPVQGTPADLLVLWVDSQGQAPLDLTGVTVQLPGEELLVPDPGEGPLTLLGGAEPRTTPTGDLQLALPELSRLASATVSAGPVSANPAWSPPELRARLAEPSTSLDMTGLRWSQPVAGPVGLVRISLSAEVLADARVDQGDLRLVDALGHQVPYLLRRRPLDQDLGELQVERSEDGSTSRLRVALPQAGEHGDGPPVSTLHLHTVAPLFSRQVTVSRARAAVLEPLRTCQWVGKDRPSELSLDIGQPVGAELIVSIDNGDDPPLPVDRVEVTVATWDMVAWLPEGGAQLVYGDPNREAPDYDLALLEQDLVSRATTEASLGARRALDPTPASSWEKGLVLGGLAALVAGLGALVLGLVRAVPEAAAEETEEG